MDKPQLKEIAPGVSLCPIKTGRFKTCRLSVSAVVPFDSDISDNFAAAALLPYILRRSSKKYPDFSVLHGKLDSLYGAQLSAGVSKQGDARCLTISIGALDDRFSLSGESIAGEAAKLLLDLLFEPNFENGVFKESEVEGEKRLMLERLEDEKSEKRAYALLRCTEIMFADEVYGRNRLGTAQEIEALDAKCVTEAWRKLLKTALIRVTVVNSGDCGEIESYLKEKFASIERKPSEGATRFVPTAGEIKNVTEEQPVKQGKLVIGLRAGTLSRSDNNPAVSVMTDLFGGGTYSRLFANVREKMSLCYYCRATFNKFKGFIFVQSGIETDNAQKARDAILAQLEEIKDGGISEDELNFSKLSFKDTLASYYDTPEMLETWYSHQILESELKSPDERAAEIEKVTLEQVTDAAKKVTLDTIYMLKGNGEDGDGDED